MPISENWLSSAAAIAKCDRFGRGNLEPDRLLSPENQHLARAKYKLCNWLSVDFVSHPGAVHRLEDHLMLDLGRIKLESRIEWILRIWAFFNEVRRNSCDNCLRRGRG